MAQVIGTNPILSVDFSNFEAPALEAPPFSTFFFVSFTQDWRAPSGIIESNAALNVPAPTVFIKFLLCMSFPLNMDFTIEVSTKRFTISSSELGRFCTISTSLEWQDLQLQPAPCDKSEFSLNGSSKLFTGITLMF